MSYYNITKLCHTSMPKRRLTPTSNGFLVGLKAIAAALGVSTRTILRWAKLHGFPLSTLPGGHRMTSERLIDLWLLARLPQQPGLPRSVLDQQRLEAQSHG